MMDASDSDGDDDGDAGGIFALPNQRGLGLGLGCGIGIGIGLGHGSWVALIESNALHVVSTGSGQSPGQSHCQGHEHMRMH